MKDNLDSPRTIEKIKRRYGDEYFEKIYYFY